MEPHRISAMMGRLWSPIVAVTTRWQGKTNAQIAVSVGAASVVPEKPRVVVQIYKENYSWELIQSSGALALNFLRPDQIALIKTFGLVTGLNEDKLAGVAHRIGVTGSPILDDCWGYLECRVINAMDGGDMSCFLGEVVDGQTNSESEPLWWPEARRVIPAQWNREWDAKIAGQIQQSRQNMEQIDYTPWNPTRQSAPEIQP